MDWIEVLNQAWRQKNVDIWYLGDGIAIYSMASSKDKLLGTNGPACIVKDQDTQDTCIHI